MTDKINNGGPAYPVHPNPSNPPTYSQGMSLRDYFAGQALVGLAIAFKDTMHIDHIVADTAYRFADAMLADREGKA